VNPEQFPALFAEGWALPKPEPFLAHFLPLIDSDATFSQPMLRTAHGRAKIERSFRQLFTLFPDFTLLVRRSAIDRDTVFIESDCTIALRRRALRFPACDRFVIRDGKLAERRVYTDPSPVLLAIARDPARWPRALRSWAL
jgi:limonene-1,2-epoxide hydrolase